MKVFVLALLLIPAAIYAQDGFGFGESGFGFSGPQGLSVSIGGEVSAELQGFFDYFDSIDSLREKRAGDIFSGHLNFSAAGSTADAFIRLNFTPVFDGSSPVEIDEAYVRAFFGPLAITGGLRKLTWGRADSFGPLDVINPIDFSDPSRLSDPQSVKMSRPMIHADWSLGSFSRLEAVFVPWFQGDSFARSGRWVPDQVKALQDAGINIDDFYPDTGTLEYAQAGLRFTTTVGSSDLGFQYYFGRLSRPAVVLRLTPLPVPQLNYNYYHQIGMDFARVIAGFNVRAEAGANLTSDLDGTDGTVENPSVVWSLGFDRDLFNGINLNLQGTGRVRLFHSSIGASPFEDIEAGSDLTSTRITGIISRNFLRDELELKATGIWGIEDRDFFLIPAITWARNDVSVELSAGFFGGNREGELGQYRDNGFFRVGLSYRF